MRVSKNPANNLFVTLFSSINFLSHLLDWLFLGLIFAAAGTG
jgi:hypothetical protein